MAPALGKLPRRHFVAAPDGLLAALLLAFLGTAGIFYVNIMPAIVSGLIDSLHFSARDAGWVGAANVYGAALGALVAVWLAPLVRWRRLAVAALLGLMLLDLLSTGLTTPAVLIAIRALHGLVGGTLVGTSFMVISRTRVPERTFGMLIFIQYGFGGLGLALLPHLVTVVGSRVLFLVIGGFSAVTLAMLPFLADYPAPVRAAANPVAARRGMSAMLVFALLAVFLFQAGNMALLAYIIELGRAYGLVLDRISLIIGTANCFGMLGTLLVMYLGVRHGRLRPLAAMMTAAVAGTLVLHLSAQIGWFILANLVTTIAWAFCVAYLFGMCAAFDRTGRGATLASFASKSGLATGPFIAGIIVGTGDWALIVNLAAATLLASLVLALTAAAALDRSEPG